MEGLQALHLFSICINQITLSPTGRVVGIDYNTWICAAKSLGYNEEIMTILFNPIEQAIIQASTKNTDGEE